MRKVFNKTQTVFETISRRVGWFVENVSARKLANMLIGTSQFVIGSERMCSWPVMVKIDISPLCNLKCTACVHANPDGNERLKNQKFHAGQKMSVQQFQRIINEIKGKSTSVSLYYLGDPLVHPDMDEMCGIAYEAGLNVHVCTNFSFILSDDRIRRIVKSGLTHLTVCVDGLSQEKYQITRVGGHIDRVLSNLERVSRFRREHAQVYPKIEVQYIKFQHNLEELEKAYRLFKEIGVDQVSTFWGSLHNYTDTNPGTYAIHGPRKKKLLPQCFWPYFGMLIKYNGDVIPCCNFRTGTQYTHTDDPRILGNVFEASIREVWNSPKYRESRRLVKKPALAMSESTTIKENFCNGCPALFETERDENVRSGSRYSFEELYSFGDKGIPVRRTGT